MYGDASIQGSFKAVFDKVYHNIRHYFHENDICILDATNVSYFARTTALCRSNCEEAWYVIMNNDIDRAKAFNKKRERYCPEYVIDKMKRTLEKEPPTEMESKVRVRHPVNIKIFDYQDENLYIMLENLNG